MEVAFLPREKENQGCLPCLTSINTKGIASQRAEEDVRTERENKRMCTGLRGRLGQGAFEGGGQHLKALPAPDLPKSTFRADNLEFVCS